MKYHSYIQFLILYYINYITHINSFLLLNTNFINQSLKIRSYFTKRFMLQNGYHKRLTSNLNNLEKSKIDDRIYYQFILDNNIPVTIVHDKKSEKSSCSLAVKVGASDDVLPGLAHITEHAVFLGSVKYPIENEYKNYLNKHGGSSNAGTGMEQTTYKFNINANAFDHALDIFSQFFKQPLFHTETMCREIMAVDAEDSKNRIIDSRRILQVLKHQIKHIHPYAKFSTGNLKTLAYGDIIKYGSMLSDSIRSFHQLHYYPDNMAIVLVGPQSIEELKQLAIEHFSNITNHFNIYNNNDSDSHHVNTIVTNTMKEEYVNTNNNNNIPVHHSSFTPSLFENGSGKLIRIKPIKDIRDIQVIWELPKTKELYRKNPCTLLGFLISYKGLNSWYSILQDQGWATSTSSGTRTEFNDFTLFEAAIALTEEGLIHWEEVLDSLYVNINTIKETSDEEIRRIWNELRIIQEIDFQYQEKPTAYELAPQLASSMLDYPMNHILSVGYLLDDMDIALFREYITYLTPKDSMVFLRSQKFNEVLENDNSLYLNELFETIDQDLKDIPSYEQKKISGEYYTLLRSYQKIKDVDDKEIEVDGWKCKKRIEPFYGVSYLISDLSNDKIIETSRSSTERIILDKIQLPKENQFICTELVTSSSSSSSSSEQSTTSSSSSSANMGTTAVLRSSPPNLITKIDDSTNNDFITTIKDNNQNELWFSKDEVFQQPRTVYYYLIPTLANDDGHPVLSLISQVFNQVATRTYYQSMIAGLDYSFNLGHRGIGLFFSGYSPKLPQLANEISTTISNITFWNDIDPSIINICKERLLRSLKSWSKERPDSQADTLLRVIMQEGAWLPQNRLLACEQIDINYFYERISNTLMNTTGILAYAHGNTEQSIAIDTLSTISKHILSNNNKLIDNTNNLKLLLPRDILSKVKERARLLPNNVFKSSNTVGDNAVSSSSSSTDLIGNKSNHHIVALPAFNPEDPNSALVTYIQTEESSPRVSAMLLYIRRMLSEPIFTELRTKKQLGYIVSLSQSGYGSGLKSVRGIVIHILSKRFSPLIMEQELIDFLDIQYELMLNTLTNEDVRIRCESIIKSLIDPPTTYTEESNEFWNAIVNDIPFNWKELIINELKLLNKDEVINITSQWLFNKQSRKSISIMLFGKPHEIELNNLQSSMNNHNNIVDNTNYIFNIDDMLLFRDSLDYHK